MNQRTVHSRSSPFRETVTLTLKDLQQHGLISVERKCLILHDLDGLQRLAHVWR